MPEPEPLVRLFGELKNKMEEYDVKFRNIPSPQTSYEEDTAEVRARIDGMWVKLHTAQPSDVPTYQDKIVELSGRLKELELRHERHVSMEEKRYQDALQLTFDNLRTDLMDVMRPKERKRGRPPGSKSGRHGTQSSSTTLLSALSTPSSSQKRQPETQGTVTVALAATPAGKRKRSRETLPSPQQKRLKLDKDPVKTPHRHPRSSHKQPDDDTAPDQQGFEGITDPEPGEVYLAFWEYSKEWIPVLILPMKDLEKVGVQGTLESLNLADLLPICYDQDALTSERTWREGYKDGQPLVTEREFPAIYFEGSKFPVKSPVGWVAAKDLRKLDVFTATSALVPQIQMVRKFLKKREADEASKSGGKGPSRERDDSLHVEDLPRQSTPDVSNQDGEPAQESPAPETAEVPKTPTDGTQPAPGSTPEAQQRPQTPTSNEKSGSGAAPDEPKEQTSTRSTRSSPTIATEAQSALQKPTQSASDATASMDAQPGPPTSTGSTQSGLTTTAETQQAPQRSTSSSPDSTTSTGPQEPTGDTQPEPSTSTEVQSAPQKSLDTTPAPDAASMEPRPHIPGGSTESAPNAPATPDTDIPMGGLRQSMFKVEPNGNIIFISSSEHESEDDETSKVEVPKLFANAPLEPMDLASPAKQPSVVEEVGVYGDEEGPPQQCTASQSQSKTETHVDFGSSDAYMQLLRSSSEIFHTVTRPDAASHKAAEPGHGDPGVARHQSEAAVTVDPAQVPQDGESRQSEITISGTSVDLHQTAPDSEKRQSEAATALASSTQQTTTQQLSARDVLLMALQPPNSEPLRHSQVGRLHRGGAMPSPRAKSQPATQYPRVGPDRGPTNTPVLNCVPPLLRPSPPPIQFTPLNMRATSTAPVPSATSLPPMGAMTGEASFPQPTPPHGSTDLSNHDHHLSNYGITRAPASTAVPVPHFPQTPSSQGQPTVQPGQGFVHQNLWAYQLPSGLVTFLEGYLRKRNAPIGINGLINSSGRYVCPFCKPPTEMTFVNTDSFVSHITRDWQRVVSHEAA